MLFGRKMRIFERKVSMSGKKDIFKKDSQPVVEYYKAICTFPYDNHPLFNENVVTKDYYFQLLSDYSLMDEKFTNHKAAIKSFYMNFFDLDSDKKQNANSLNEQKLLNEVRKLRYEFKKYNIRSYTYRYLFFAHYLFLRYGLITEEDTFVQNILQGKRLKINKKDALQILNFTNAIKSGDFDSTRLFIKNKKFEFLLFFYQSFKDYYAYRQSKEKRFLVIGTMSAGKSTFLNSILGRDLLPAQNEACTSKIYEYVNRPYIDHFITTKNGEESFTCLFDLNEKNLHEWNNDTGVEQIQLEGSLSSVNPINTQVTFIDTPGTNNSMDRTHSDITLQAIKSNMYDTVLYLMNATQLGTDDDKRLLNKVREHFSIYKEKDIIFVVNKVDEIDESGGESVAEFVKNTENYLTKNGFKKPQILFISALAAKLSQMVLAEQALTRKERNMFNFYYEFFSEKEADLTQYSKLDNKFLLDTTRTDQVAVQDQLYDISRIYKIINHSGIIQITNLI